jgi:hypothetical protein
VAKLEASFGIMPWQISHALFGWATPEIDLIYWSWFVVQPVALYLVILSAPSAHKTQTLITFALTTLVLGIVAAYLLSSAGPIFYDRVFGGQTFGALTSDLAGQAPNMMHAQHLLWEAYSNHVTRLGNGISAMPSFHVALCMWLVLATKRASFRIFAQIYLAIIWIGSVHLGWHYFSDGLVASLGVLALWRVAPTIAPFQINSEKEQPSLA